MIVIFSRDIHTGALTWVSEMTTLPEGIDTEPAGAAIHFHPSNRSLFVSNRNSETVTVFDINDQGDLAHVTSFASGGNTPRDFTFDRSGQWLVVANQDSNNLSVYELHPSTGHPVTSEAISTYECGSPVSLLFY